MTTTFHALWMLCALGAVVHAATAAHRVRDVTALAVGFVLATIVASPQRLPDPEWVGALSAGVAIAVLFRPRLAVLAAGWGGALGGMLTALTEVQGVPAAASVGPVVVLIATVVWLTRLRPSFAPDRLRDEALLAITLLGLVVVRHARRDRWLAGRGHSHDRARDIGPGHPCSGVDAHARRYGHGARRRVFPVESPVSILAALEQGLFALGQVLRFPVMVLLWVCVAAAVFMAGSCVVDFVARKRERRGFDVTMWLKSGTVLDAPEARRRALPALLRTLVADVENARQEHRIDAGGLEHLVLESEERLRHSLNAARVLVKVGPSLGLLGTLIPMGSSLASLATGDLAAMAGQMVVAFTTTIIGLATGTLAYVVAAARQSWVNETIREQRFIAEHIAQELARS